MSNRHQDNTGGWEQFEDPRDARQVQLDRERAVVNARIETGNLALSSDSENELELDRILAHEDVVLSCYWLSAAQVNKPKQMLH